MRLIEHEGMYAVIQDDGIRIVDIKLNGKHIHKFKYVDLANIAFAGWLVLTPREIVTYQYWETLRKSKKLKVLKRYTR